jgi:CheY-like chemotaxis protein
VPSGGLDLVARLPSQERHGSPEPSLPSDGVSQEDAMAERDAEVVAPLREQMHRRHVLIINRDAALLDGARALLQDERYNVTTTSLVPRTGWMIHALAPDVIVVDLALDEPELWQFVGRLLGEPRLQVIPVIFTAVDPALLARAQALPHQLGGRFVFLKPFRAADLVDCVHALVGPA